MRQCCKVLRVVLVCRKPSGNGGSSDGISFDLQTPLPVGWVQSGTWSGVSLVGSPQLLRLELRSMEKVWGGCFYLNRRKEVPTEEQAPGGLIWHQGCRCARWARWSPAGVLQCSCGCQTGSERLPHRHHPGRAGSLQPPELSSVVASSGNSANMAKAPKADPSSTTDAAPWAPKPHHPVVHFSCSVRRGVPMQRL